MVRLEIDTKQEYTYQMYDIYIPVWLDQKL